MPPGLFNTAAKIFRRRNLQILLTIRNFASVNTYLKIMKKIYISVGRITASLSSLLLGLLGFSSCDDNGSNLCMYGTPNGSFELKGTVTDEQGQPVDDAQVIIKEYNGYNGTDEQFAAIDTIGTDENGDYSASGSVFPGSPLRVVCQPGQSNLEADSVTVKPEFKGKKSDGWYVGHAVIDRDFILKRKK